MGFLTQLTKTTLDVAVSPISVAKDIVTMGGVLTDEDEPYTVDQLNKILEDISDLPNSVDDGIV